MRFFSRRFTHAISPSGGISARAAITTLILLGTFTLAPADEPVAENAPVPTQEQIQQWIEQLGDDDFQVRDAAQAALVVAGNPAYFALEQSPVNSDLEVRTRVKRTMEALEDDAAVKLRESGGYVAKRDGSDHWNYLSISDSELSNDAFEPLLRLPHLATVQIEDAPVTDGALLYLRRLKNLRDVSFYRVSFTDAGLATIAECPSIEHVGLLLPKMTNDGLRHLAKLPSLRRLTIFDAPIDGNGLAHLRPHQNRLEVLQLEGCNIADDDLRHLQEFEALRVLRLSRTRISGKGLEYIEGLPNLERLLLQRNDLNEESLAHVARMPALTHVHLTRTGITSNGVKMLLNSQSLEHVDLSAESFSAETLERFQEDFDDRAIGVRTVVHGRRTSK